MEKTKRYYWIKLKTDFFNLAEIDFLLSQKDGCRYIVLYQMLCLQTANNNEELASRVGEMIIPYDPDKIARDTKYFSKDTVIVAMELFKKLNLIYTDDGICLKIAGFENMVGSETSWAKQKREQREKQKLLSGQCPPNSPQEIDIEIDEDIETDGLNDRLKLINLKLNKTSLVQEELKKNNQIVQESQVVPSIVKMNYYLVEPDIIKDLYQMEQAIVENITIMKKKVQDTQESLLKGNIRMNEEMKKLVKEKVKDQFYNLKRELKETEEEQKEKITRGKVENGISNILGGIIAISNMVSNSQINYRPKRRIRRYRTLLKQAMKEYAIKKANSSSFDWFDEGEEM